MTNMDAPIASVMLNVDTLERRKGEAKDPFAFLLAGRRIEMKDSSEIDWQVLMELDHPIDLLRATLSKEDREFLAEQRFPGWKLREIMRRYYDYHDIPMPMGKDVASRLL